MKSPLGHGMLITASVWPSLRPSRFLLTSENAGRRSAHPNLATEYKRENEEDPGFDRSRNHRLIADEQLSRLIVGQTGTLGGTVEWKTGIDETQALKRFGKMMVGPPGLEPARAKNNDDEKTRFALDLIALSSETDQ